MTALLTTAASLRRIIHTQGSKQRTHGVDPDFKLPRSGYGPGSDITHGPGPVKVYAGQVDWPVRASDWPIRGMGKWKFEIWILPGRNLKVVCPPPFR